MDHCSSLSVTVLDDAWRATTYNPYVPGNDVHCDRDLSGWYRFKMQGKEAMIHSDCVDVSISKSKEVVFLVDWQINKDGRSAISSYFQI